MHGGGEITGQHIITDFKQGKFELFYRFVYPGLLLYANKMLGPRHEIMAEDHVQDAVFKAWERRTAFESLNSLKSFLLITVRNGIISIHRRDSSFSRYLDHAAEENDDLYIDIIDSEARMVLFNAISRLPAKMRRVLELNFFEGLKIAEITERMNLTDSSVKKYKAAGLAILRRRLDPSIFMMLLAGLAEELV